MPRRNRNCAISLSDSKTCRDTTRRFKNSKARCKRDSVEARSDGERPGARRRTAQHRAAALGETERYYAEQKGLMTDDEVQVAGAKHKLAQAKNSKEYMAAQREIEQRREAVVAREGEIAKLVEAVDAKKKLLADRANDVEALKASIAKDGDAGQGAHGRDRGEDRRAARRARQAGRQREAGRAQALQQHPDAPRPGGRQRPQRHLPGLQHEHPAAALQRPAARPDGRDLPLLPPHHLLGGDHEGRPGRRLELDDAVRR